MASLAYIQVTRDCNQECRFCSNPPTEKAISLKQAKRLVDDYLKRDYAGIILSGGEPTLYPHLPELVSYIAKKKFSLRIITNGQKTADIRYLRSLTDAGLSHICVSVYSEDPKVQAFLTNNKESLANVKKTLDNLRRFNLNVDIATVINRYNAGHLSRVVMRLVKDYPFIRHFIWNNLDPLMNRASRNPDTIPRLADFESELHKAMAFLDANGRTFRAERVPLCYMTEFSHCSTETRKIVKKEERAIYFLDEKGLKFQKGWVYGKADCCRACSLNEICAGLYQMGKYFSEKELYPVFVSKGIIVKRILADS
jgi:MoaA/NifB/PqqE/SkfB family radical SAM enzyme